MTDEGKETSVDLIYQLAAKSYEAALKRMDTANARLQVLLSLTITVTLAIPVVLKAQDRPALYALR